MRTFTALPSYRLRYVACGVIFFMAALSIVGVLIANPGLPPDRKFQCGCAIGVILMVAPQVMIGIMESFVAYRVGATGIAQSGWGRSTSMPWSDVAKIGPTDRNCHGFRLFGLSGAVLTIRF